MCSKYPLKSAKRGSKPSSKICSMCSTYATICSRKSWAAIQSHEENASAMNKQFPSANVSQRSKPNGCNRRPIASWELLSVALASALSCKDASIAKANIVFSQLSVLCQQYMTRKTCFDCRQSIVSQRKTGRFSGLNLGEFASDHFWYLRNAVDVSWWLRNKKLCHCHRDATASPKESATESQTCFFLASPDRSKLCCLQ